MANKWFDITEEKFISFLKSLEGSISSINVPYMIFGGIAHQIHMAKFLTGIYGKSLEDLALSDEINLPNYLRATDNVDIAFGLPQDEVYTKRIEELGEQNNKAIAQYEKVRKLSRNKTGYITKLDKEEQERRADLNQKIRNIDNERGSLRDSKILGIMKDFEDKEIDSLTGNEIVSIKEIKRGYSKLQYTLGSYGIQDETRPISVNLCREAKEVSRNGFLKELDPAIYSNFLFEAKNVEFSYNERVSVNFRVMRAEDLLVTKILTNRENDIKEALDLFAYAAKSGNPIDYNIVEAAVLKERSVLRVEEGKEKLVKMSSPVLADVYRKFRDRCGDN